MNKCIAGPNNEYDHWYQCRNIKTLEIFKFVISDEVISGAGPGGNIKITFNQSLKFNGYILPKSISEEEFKICVEKSFEWINT